MGTYVMTVMDALVIQAERESTKKEQSNERNGQKRFNKEEHLSRGKGRHIPKVNIILKGKQMCNMPHESLAGPQTSGIFIIWGLVRNAESQSPTYTYKIRTYVFNKIPREFLCLL